MKLNKFLEAKSDLEEALLVEPRNKDILRELCVVKNCLAINLNGKRRIDDHPLQDPTENGKVRVYDDEPPMKNLRDSGSDADSNSRGGVTTYQDVNINLYGGSLTQSPVTEKCGMEIDSEKFVSDRQSCITVVSPSTSEVSCNFDGCTMVNSPDEKGPKDLNGDSHGAEKKMFQFSNKKGRGHSVLKIDAGTYKKLLDGKEVTFFQKSHFSSLKIRVRKPCINESETGSVTSQKKKRKRRKRTKGLRASTLTIVTDSTKNDGLQLSSVTPNNSIDRDQLIEDNSHQPPYFIFTSSKSKVAKVFRRRGTRIQSRREEPPRRNVYIYPGKFPRSRDVSVSCCRYFSKAQLTKKRKDPMSSMCYSNNSVKKPRVFSYPAPSLCLSSCINNVDLAPDFSSPRCSM